MAEIVLKNIKKIYPNEKKSKSLFGKKTEQKKSNLEVTEEGVVAVQDFNLTIKEHEFVVLVGPSKIFLLASFILMESLSMMLHQKIETSQWSSKAMRCIQI